MCGYMCLSQKVFEVLLDHFLKIKKKALLWINPVTNVFLSKKSTTPHCCEDLDGGNDCLCNLLYNAVGLEAFLQLLYPLAQAILGE